MPSIYLDASNQVENVGVGSYEDEAHRMQFLADLVKVYIEKGQGNITVYRNNINMSLRETVDHANSLLPDNYLALHSNAGGGKGTEAFHYPGSLEGYDFIKNIYDEVAPITISSDRGIKEADFFVLRETVMVAGLIEIMFHDNLTDVNDYLSKIDRIAKLIAIGIYKHHGIEYKEPTPQPQPTNDNWLEILKTVSPYWKVWETFVNEHQEVNLKGLIVKLWNKGV